MDYDLLNNVRINENEPDKFEKLCDLYNTYQFNYKDLFIEHLSLEEAALKKAFPQVKFIAKARIKSRFSYKNKVQKNIDDGKSRKYL